MVLFISDIEDHLGYTPTHQTQPTQALEYQTRYGTAARPPPSLGIISAGNPPSIIPGAVRREQRCDSRRSEGTRVGSHSKKRRPVRHSNQLLYLEKKEKQQRGKKDIFFRSGLSASSVPIAAYDIRVAGLSEGDGRSTTQP